MTDSVSQESFFILWGGQALSLLGSQAVQFALIWWLTVETGSAAILATATLLALLPQVVLGPVIGVLVDRWSRKWIMFFADGAVALASAVLAWLFLAGQAGVASVLIILFIRGLGSAFHGPAMTASTSLMVPEKLLTRIQGLNQTLQGGLSIVAAPLGALLTGLLSVPAIMAVDIVTALFAVIPLLFIHVPQPARSVVAGPGSRLTGLAAEMMAGLRYLLARRGHMALIGLATVVNLCLVPAFALLPILVSGQLQGGAFHLGGLTSVFGVGTLAGGILLGIWGGFRRRILTSLTALVGLGLATVALGMAPPMVFAPAAAALFVVGFMAPLVNGPILAVLQATVAPDHQGRVFTLLGSLAGAMAPLGLLVAAPVAEALGVRFWYLAGGLICSALGAAAFFIGPIVRLEDAACVAAPLVEAEGAGEAAGGERSLAT